MIKITDFGAVGDGKTINTDCINEAIKSCALNGGGKVVVPTGVFMTGSIQLKSNVCLYLENGAVLKSTAEIKDFPPIGFHHNEMGEVTSLIWAINEKNISICGHGVIDISSDITYSGYETERYLTDKSLLSAERLSEGIYPKNNDRVNQPIFFESCEKINIKDIEIINSTCWTITFSQSKNIHISSITIDNDMCVQNDDGIHFSACQNITVSDCNISCADDCIAMTCITHLDGMNRNIVINNCNLRSRSAAVRVGHNVDGLCMTNLNIYNSNRGIGIFTREHSSISNVSISNVRVETALLAGAWWGKAEPIVVSAANDSSIENISISDVNGVCENGIIIYGENNIDNLTLNNIKLKVKKTDYFSSFCNGLDLRPYKMIDDDCGPFLFRIQGVGEILFNNVNIDYL